jgi:hypothetical protein
LGGRHVVVLSILNEGNLRLSPLLVLLKFRPRNYSFRFERVVLFKKGNCTNFALDYLLKSAYNLFFAATTKAGFEHKLEL